MRALLCPASLKGVLSATEAAAALASGVRGAGVEAVELPTADGGEGTADAMYATLGGTWQEAVVADPLGRGPPAALVPGPDPQRAPLTAYDVLETPRDGGRERAQ